MFSKREKITKIRKKLTRRPEKMESLRGLFTRMWESGMKTYEEGLQQEVSAMEEFLKGSDKLYVCSYFSLG